MLEDLPFFHRQTVRLGDDWHDIDNLAQFLHHDDVDRAKRVTSRVDEVQAAVNTCVLDVAVTNGCQLFAQVRAVLVLDVFDDSVPAENTSGYMLTTLGRHRTHQFSLLTISPYPGVSTMFNRRRTPFSVITGDEVRSH